MTPRSYEISFAKIANTGNCLNYCTSIICASVIGKYFAPAGLAAAAVFIHTRAPTVITLITVAELNVAPVQFAAHWSVQTVSYALVKSDNLYVLLAAGRVDGLLGLPVPVL